MYNETKVNLDIESPKIIIDEHLLTYEVMFKDKPMFFLLDMGHLRVQNSVEQMSMAEFDEFGDT